MLKILLLNDYWEHTCKEQNQSLVSFLLSVFIYFYTKISFFVIIKDHSNRLVQLELYYLYLTWVLKHSFLLRNQFILKSKIFLTVITISYCLSKQTGRWKLHFKSAGRLRINKECCVTECWMTECNFRFHGHPEN